MLSNKLNSSTLGIRISRIMLERKRWWPIPSMLYHEMQRYSSDSTVRKLQLMYDRFLVMDCPTLHLYGIIGTTYATSAITSYVKVTLGLISPRTELPLHITGNRIRHTGATRLAFNGVSRDNIPHNTIDYHLL